MHVLGRGPKGRNLKSTEQSHAVLYLHRGCGRECLRLSASIERASGNRGPCNHLPILDDVYPCVHRVHRQFYRRNRDSPIVRDSPDWRHLRGFVLRISVICRQLAFRRHFEEGVIDSRIIGRSLEVISVFQIRPDKVASAFENVWGSRIERGDSRSFLPVERRGEGCLRFTKVAARISR